MSISTIRYIKYFLISLLFSGLISFYDYVNFHKRYNSNYWGISLSPLFFLYLFFLLSTFTVLLIYISLLVTNYFSVRKVNLKKYITLLIILLGILIGAHITYFL